MNEQEWHKTANAQHEMNEQKLREEFERWRDESPNQRYGYVVWEAWRAACAGKQREIEGLQATARFWNDRANDNQQQIHELAAQIEVMREALMETSREFRTGYLSGGSVQVSDMRTEALAITPSEALTKHNAELRKEIANDYD